MKYHLSASVTVSAYTIVEAESLEKAIEISRDREVAIGLLHTSNDPHYQWIIEDADGQAQDIHES
jgi:hypothetical protein